MAWLENRRNEGGRMEGKVKKPIRRLIIFLPVAKPGVDTDFLITYNQAYKYLTSHLDELPWELEIMEYYCQTFPIDANRNECATRFIEGVPIEGKRVWRADISIWFDTDHTIPLDTFTRLLLHDKPIVLGIYYLKTKKRDQPFYPVLFKRNEKKRDIFKAVMEFPKDELFEVDFAGMGAACIKREVFEAIESPYFEYSRHPLRTNASDSEFKHMANIKDVSEDKYFWDQVKDKTDYKILVDPKVQFGHIGKMIFDQYMYSAWLGEYKRKLLEQKGEIKFKELWGEMGIAEPYKEQEDVDRGTKKRKKTA